MCDDVFAGSVGVDDPDVVERLVGGADVGDQRAVRGPCGGEVERPAVCDLALLFGAGVDDEEVVVAVSPSGVDDAAAIG